MSGSIPKVHEVGVPALGASHGKKKLRQQPSLPAVPDEESVCHGAAPSLGSMKCELKGSVKRSDTPAVLNLSEKKKNGSQ